MKKTPARRFSSTTLAALACAACAWLVTGCVNAIDMSSSTPAQLNARTADGRSPALHSGDHFAFWLWRDEDNAWHLRTTTAGKSHRFQGRIHPVAPTAITELHVIGLEGGRHADQVAMVGPDVSVDFTTKGKEDGMDFKVSGEACLEFDLRIDGDGDPGKIFIGKSQTKPASAHFMLCP
jgi:hypothetical protein